MTQSHSLQYCFNYFATSEFVPSLILAANITPEIYLSHAEVMCSDKQCGILLKLSICQALLEYVALIKVQ